MHPEELYHGGRIGDLILTALRRYPDRVAFESGLGQTTYRELAGMIASAQRSFESLGIQKGQTVAQLVGNDVRTFAFLAACYMTGLRAVSLQPTSGHDDKCLILVEAEARLLVTDAQHADQASELRGACPHVEHWYAHGSVDGWRDFWTLSPSSNQFPTSTGSAEDIARLSYTGGTTGRPKGVMISHRTLITNAMLMLSGMRWPETTRYLCALPMTHGAGGLIIPTLHRGGTVILQRQFDVEMFLDAMQAHRCTVTWLVPTTIYRLLDHPRTRAVDWTSMTSLVYSAAPITVARLDEALDVFGPCLVQMYGQTEAPATVLVLTQEDHVSTCRLRRASAGRPFPGVQVTLLGDDGSEVQDGEVGEICVRGPLVMSGYWKQPQQTETALAGNWLHTGDLARRDADGYFYIVDRKKDMIISGGFNVYPQEIENVLARHPAVTQSAVVGVPDPDWGEAVKAFVQLKDGARAEAAELIAMVRDAKGPVYAPKSIAFLAQLPLTTFGKVDKKALRTTND